MAYGSNIFMEFKVSFTGRWLPQPAVNDKQDSWGFLELSCAIRSTWPSRTLTRSSALSSCRELTNLGTQAYRGAALADPDWVADADGDSLLRETASSHSSGSCSDGWDM